MSENSGGRDASIIDPEVALRIAVTTEIYINEDDINTDKEKINSILKSLDYPNEPAVQEYGAKYTKIIGKKSLEEVMEIEVSDRNISIYTENPFRYFLTRVDVPDKVISFETILVKEEENNELVRNPYLPHFRELVAISFAYYQRRGIDIAGMRGNWSIRDEDMMTNTEIYAIALQNGFSKSQAALATPTGKSAAEYGFTNVTVDDSKVIQNGEIEVLFMK